MKMKTILHIEILLRTSLALGWHLKQCRMKFDMLGEGGTEKVKYLARVGGYSVSLITNSSGINALFL